jgi:hypothetical protein
LLDNAPGEIVVLRPDRDEVPGHLDLKRVADDEVREHVEPRVGQHRAAERLRPEVPAGRIGDVLGVPAGQRHLQPGVADLVDELDVVAVAQLVVGDRAHQH